MLSGKNSVITSGKIAFDDITFEEATREDIKPLFAFNRELIDLYENKDQIDYDKVLLWVKGKLEENISKYNRILWRGKKVGYFRFNEAGEEAELDDLYIFPEYRCQGIGTQVVKHCLKDLRKPCMLYVFIKNERAVTFYWRLGFRISENIKNSRYIMRYNPSI